MHINQGTKQKQVRLEILFDRFFRQFLEIRYNISLQ